MNRKLILAPVLLALTLAGCMSFARNARRELIVPDNPDQAYAKAVRATMAIAGAIGGQDPHLRIVSARIHNVIALNVTVTAQPTGAVVTVSEQTPTTHIALGPMTLVDDWIAAYQRQP